ncbi:uncharacterized protein LOC132545377 [Ylistrum balloti]|uniref:uncharacterized protein LOC132545377 n=1 Tax=Ylistrum balloti TaxID=509963 RepID=UPI0029059DD5|nr:uncharacterized protein LOC132545377 [Ylistrum balloti]
MRDSLSVLLFLLLCVKFTSASRWTIIVITSDEIEAGTTANVFASLLGTQGYAENISLGNGHDPGKVKYVTKTMIIGLPFSMTVWHDNAGVNPDWRLERIVFIDQTTWAQYMFVCKCWITAINGPPTITLNVKDMQIDEDNGKLNYRYNDLIDEDNGKLNGRYNGLIDEDNGKLNGRYNGLIDEDSHLSLPRRRKKTFPQILTDSHMLDITIEDPKGRANISVFTDNSTGYTDGVNITIEIEDVTLGSDRFIVYVRPQKILPDTCQHTPLCLCYQRKQQNMTEAGELQRLVDELKAELTVDKKKTSVNLRKYISADDSRVSSKAIGSGGAILLAVPVVLIILSDLLNVLKKKKKRRRGTYSFAKTINSPCYVEPPEYMKVDVKEDFFANKDRYYPESCSSSANKDRPTSSLSDENASSTWSIVYTTNQDCLQTSPSDVTLEGEYSS